MDLTVIKGNIAKQSADALVNAANTSMRMGTGVSGALQEEGGDALNDAAVEKGPVALGDVVVTDAYELDAEYVLHAATMTPHGTASTASILKATQNTLRRAEGLECDTIVIPVLGTGSGGFATAEGARIITRVVAAHQPDTLSTIRLITYSEDSYRTVQRVSEEVLNM